MYRLAELEERKPLAPILQDDKTRQFAGLDQAGDVQLADDRFEVSASPSSFAGHLMQASIQAPDSDLD